MWIGKVMRSLKESNGLANHTCKMCKASVEKTAGGDAPTYRVKSWYRKEPFGTILSMLILAGFSSPFVLGTLLLYHLNNELFFLLIIVLDFPVGIVVAIAFVAIIQDVVERCKQEIKVSDRR